MPEVTEGVIVGGWSYAIAAYVITAVVLVSYTWSLLSRYKKAAQAEEVES